jgi:hypothetical protein
MNINIKIFIYNSLPYRLLTFITGYKNWAKAKFQAPSPHYIKQAYLIRNSFPNATWI